MPMTLLQLEVTVIALQQQNQAIRRDLDEAREAIAELTSLNRRWIGEEQFAKIPAPSSESILARQTRGA